MTIIRNRQEPDAVEDEQRLAAILEQRDKYGGGEFWLSEQSDSYPCLAIVVSGDMSFAMYFPDEGHPGFRCLRPDHERSTTHDAVCFVWDGCDPGSGELTPYEFVVPFSTSLSAARAFFRDRSLPKGFPWLEL